MADIYLVKLISWSLKEQSQLQLIELLVIVYDKYINFINYYTLISHQNT